MATVATLCVLVFSQIAGVNLINVQQFVSSIVGAEFSLFATKSSPLVITKSITETHEQSSNSTRGHTEFPGHVRTTNLHSDLVPISLPALFDDMAIECGCNLNPPCSKCGIVNCWDSEKEKIAKVCSSLFKTTKSSGKRIRSGRNSTKTINAEKFDAVLDFDCDHKYYFATFHALVDCFNVQLSMVAMIIEQNKNKIDSEPIRSVAIASPQNLVRYMELVCITFKTHGIKPTFFNITFKSVQDSECLRRHFSSKSIAFTAGYKSWFAFRWSKFGSSDRKRAILIKGGQLFAGIVREAYHKQNRKCDKIIVISRKTTRRFKDQADLLGALASNFGRENILVYNGRESLTKTIKFFKRACAVIGYHGAGAINMLLTPPSTLCLEIVVFARTSTGGGALDWNPWRSNRARIGAAAGSEWQLKLLEPHHLWVPRRHAAKPDPLKHGDVLLTREHIADIVSRVEAHLGTIDHGIARRKSAPASVTVPFQVPDVRLGFK
jgi:hypothetical protein